MTIEDVVKVIFFLQLGVLVVMYAHIWLRIRRAIKKGDAFAVYSLAQGLLVSKSFRDRLLIEALKNEAANELSLAKERRKSVITLLSKIPGIQIVRTVLEEDDVPSRR